MSDEFQKMLHRAVMFATGAAVMTSESVKRFVDEMVKRGEMSRPDADEFARELLDRSRRVREEIAEAANRAVRSAMKEAGAATREDLAELARRIEALEERLA